jgi:hypothetical protein
MAWPKLHSTEPEGMPGHVLIETLTFEGHDGNTKLTDTSVFQTVEDRDGRLRSGMEEGAAKTLDRFAELLATRHDRGSQRSMRIGGRRQEAGGRRQEAGWVTSRCYSDSCLPAAVFS